jgi:carbon-monoxide dehydrogenase medium subunit
VKPADLELHQPTSVRGAIELLARYGSAAKVLAGGQSLVPLLSFRLARPEHVIDLSQVPGLGQIRRSREALHVGALVTHAQAGRSAAVSEAAPLIAAAIPHIGHDAIRARGTVVGSIAHADPAAELPAVALALDVAVIAWSARGERVIPAADFFVGNLMTALADDELITEIRVPGSPPGSGAAFEEVGRRQGDFALAGAGAHVVIRNAVLAEARICLTGVAGRPVRAIDAERLLIGRTISPGVVREAVDAVRSAVAPSSDLHAPGEYRRAVAGTLAGRALERAVHNASSRSHEEVVA